MSSGDRARIERLQQRVEEALRELPHERARSRFSPYIPDRKQLSYRLADAAGDGDLEGLERLLDLRDDLAGEEDPVALRHAVMVALTHFPGGLSKLGLRMPSLEQRAAWKVTSG